jgi:hypothetical protein
MSFSLSSEEKINKFSKRKEIAKELIHSLGDERAKGKKRK